MSRRPPITVIGAGLMGHGIAADFLDAGHPVTLADIRHDALESARSDIAGILRDLRNRQDPEHGERMSALSTVALEDEDALTRAVSGASFVVEAVAENIPLKQELYEKLDRICPPSVILASNTSTILPSVLAERATRHPERIAIAHYVNPPHIVPLVEVVPGPATSRETIEALLELLRNCGKQPIDLKSETPGFVVNRLQMALLREACHLVQEGIASPEEVDIAIRTSMGRRWAAAGVFEVFDIGGWDVLCSVMRNLLPHLNSSTGMPPLMQEREDRGEIGIKSGTGFYRWDEPSLAAARERIARSLAFATSLEQTGPRPPANPGAGDT